MQQTNTYTFIYAGIMTVVVAIVLAFSSEGLRPAQEANIALEKKMNILNAVGIRNKEKNEYVSIYDKSIKAIAVNSQGEEVAGAKAFDIDMRVEMAKNPQERNLPIFVFTNDNGKKNYIVPATGKGLWGSIWGYVAIEEDGNTLAGSFYDHKSETPGLGAEINTESFQDQFKGKKILDESNKVVIEVVKKGTVTLNEHRVDGISGGTITSRGTDKMLKECLSVYLPFFNKMKSKNS